MVAALRRAVELGTRVDGARGALAAGDFSRASRAIGDLAREAPDDPDVQALRADLARAAQRAGLLGGTQAYNRDKTAVLESSGSGPSDDDAAANVEHPGRAETQVLMDRPPRREGEASKGRTRILPPGAAEPVRRSPSTRTLLLVGLPLVAVVVLGLIYQVLIWTLRSPEPVPVTAATPIPPTNAPTATAVLAVPTAASSPAQAVAEPKPPAPPVPTPTPAPPTATVAPPTATPAPPTPTQPPPTAVPPTAGGSARDRPPERSF